MIIAIKTCIYKKKVYNYPRSWKRILYGCVAQLVEQLTLNQWVQGSSPCASTKNLTTVYRSFNFCKGRRTKNPSKGSERQLVKTSETQFEPYVVKGAHKR